jgi:hypothetical protein
MLANGKRPDGPWMSAPLALMIALTFIVIALLTHGFGWWP